ncbi:nucleotide exchange factor GrpE [Rothia sp. CCM 9418]|uniref:nucleotide exchange factor GrpE n=1 Tax=Rothia sp. CCM 9418 TaxID=3402661 RepID=UPI003AE700B9
MSENTNNSQNTDPLEEAFNAPSAPEHPEPQEDAGTEPLPEDVSAEAEASEEVAEDFEQVALERLEDLRRLQAEFTNFKNRSAKEKEQLRQFVISDVVSALLPVIDDIDAARQHGDLEEGPFAAIANKLEETLGKQGMERYGAVGDKFDPKVHEAVLQQPSEDIPEDHVAMVLRHGYRVNDRIVRTAQVAVAAAM